MSNVNLILILILKELIIVHYFIGYIMQTNSEEEKNV